MTLAQLKDHLLEVQMAMTGKNVDKDLINKKLEPLEEIGIHIDYEGNVMNIFPDPSDLTQGADPWDL